MEHVNFCGILWYIHLYEIILVAYIWLCHYDNICPFNLKDCLGKIANNLSEMLVEFFYEFASENARNAVIELQE